MLAAASSFANISIIDAVSNAISGKTDTSAVLEAFAKNTALATHTNLADSAVKLDKAVAEFVLKPTESNLGEVARLWRQTRQYWEQSEAFNFGPTAFAGLDPKLDSWPMDAAQIEVVIKNVNDGKIEIDAGYVRDGLGAAFRGFHAVEYLVFRDGKVRNPKDFSKGELAYLAAITKILAEDSVAVESWWRGADALSKEKAEILQKAEIETSGSYANEVARAGKSGSRYESAGEAIEEIFDGCIDTATELAESKLGGPAKSKDAADCESRFSGTTLVDVRNNLISIRNSYEGVNAGANSVSALVAARSKTADEAVKAAIAKALKDVDSLKAPLFSNIEANAEGLKTAIASCEALVESLEKAKNIVSR